MDLDKFYDWHNEEQRRREIAELKEKGQYYSRLLDCEMEYKYLTGTQIIDITNERDYYENKYFTSFWSIPIYVLTTVCTLYSKDFVFDGFVSYLTFVIGSLVMTATCLFFGYIIKSLAFNLFTLSEAGISERDYPKIRLTVLVLLFIIPIFFIIKSLF